MPERTRRLRFRSHRSFAKTGRYRPLQRPPCKNGERRRTVESDIYPFFLCLLFVLDFFRRRELICGHLDDRCASKRCTRIRHLHFGHVAITGVTSACSRSVFGGSLALASPRFDAFACNFLSVLRDGRSTIARSSDTICSDVFSASGEDRKWWSPWQN